MRRNYYYQLITSLPMLQGKLSSSFTHISRIAFDKKISSLKPEDFEMITDLENFIIWEKRSMDDDTDEEFERKALHLQKKHKNSTFKELLNEFIIQRLVIGFLRKNRNDLSNFAHVKEMWQKKFVEYDENFQFEKQGLKLDLVRIARNLKEYSDFISSNKSLELERKLLVRAWNYCAKMAEGHYFDIDFILIYAIRRNIVERWHIINSGQDIKEKINSLAMEAINNDKEEE